MSAGLSRFVATLLSMLMVSGTACARSEMFAWNGFGTARRCEVFAWPNDRSGLLPVAFYLRNTAAPRVGRASDQDCTDWLKSRGFVVVWVDFEEDANTTPEAMAIQVLAARRALTRDLPNGIKNLQPGIDLNRVFFVPAGCVVSPEIEYMIDGDRVMKMDVIHPLNPAEPVPLVVEFSCDNQNRMGNGSLVFCHDALLEVAAFRGFAAAMADHPVRPPYKGIDDPMPRSLEWAAAAINVLRQRAAEFHSSGRIGAIGFSRGATFAAMLAAGGDVEAALVHGNRFDYTNLSPDDPMLARFERAWGPIESNRETWAVHGAVHHLTKDASPMFLNTSDAESAEYRLGLEQLHQALAGRNVEHEYRVDADGRGHRVSTDPQTLKDMFDFLEKHLAEPDWRR